MPAWLFYALWVILLWGIVGVLQKLGTDRIAPQSLMVWLTVGYVLLLPMLLAKASLSSLGPQALLVGILGGLSNGLGAWSLFAALEHGGKASVVVPLTALNPLLTIGLAGLFLSERPTALQWMGILLAILAAALISYETVESPSPGVPGVQAHTRKEEEC